MPNCFNLTRKTATNEGPVKLAQIDDELCKHLGVVADPVKYHLGWYDSVGFGLATGLTFDQLRKMCKDSGDTELLPVIDFLDANFTALAWSER